MIQLSPYVLPQVRVGHVRITTLNMRESPERLAYVQGVQAHVESLVRLFRADIASRADVERFHERVHLAKLFAPIDWDAPGGAVVTRWDSAADFVSFNAEHLGVLFLDGRLRDEREMLYVPTGSSTPAFATVLAALARGTQRAELLTIAAAGGVDLDDDFVDMLLERGVIEQVADPRARVPARFAQRSGDRLTWLGHAGVLFQSGPTSVWFDPLLPPRMQYLDEELPAAFADHFATPRYFTTPPDRDCEQLVHLDLPRPDAVVITHADIDHFDLGLLMCLPESTPIVVPATDPSRPWEVDLAATIGRVVGERRVIRLARGEQVRFGDVEITATPFFGEWPRALPTDWNCYVVKGLHGAAVLAPDASIIAEHATAIAEALGDRGPRAIMFAFELYPGAVRYYEGFREDPTVPLAPSRPWPWFLPMEHLFDQHPYPGIASDLLRAIGERTGLRRYFPFASGGAPWFTFAIPHAHRHNIESIREEVHERQIRYAAAIGFDVPRLLLGHPFEL